MTEKVISTQINEVDDGSGEQKTANYSAVDQTIYLIFGITELLLLIRFVFKLTGASLASGIVKAIYAFTNIMMMPFKFIFPTNVIEGAVFEWSTLVAIFFYALLAWIIAKLINIIYTTDKG